ncbi:MAG: hypothetical protein KC492_27150, partial [Myxococcales bacterium]|nr:hypothetical protein [Myxococcales bacterium]
MIHPLISRLLSCAGFLAALSSSLTAGAAQSSDVGDPTLAAASEPEPAPYAPYQGEGIAGPGPSSSAVTPAPLAEEPEFARRSVELVLYLGL